MKAQASIRGGVLRSQLVWSLLGGLALAGALWLSVQSEVDELLDDSLSSAAELLIGPMLESLPPPSSRPADGRTLPREAGPRFIWQLVRHDSVASVLAGASGAPGRPLVSTPAAGFTDVPGWRVYGRALGLDGRMLYVAQSHQERAEVKLETITTVLLAGLPLLALGLLWSNLRLRQELQPLQALSSRLATFDPLQPGASLGRTNCTELQPVHAAVDALVARLQQRITLERAFSAHTAHALRTPLAGIEVQLAVAQREALPAPAQADLKTALGWAMDKADVLASGELLDDDFTVLGVAMQPLDVTAQSRGSKVTERRVWLQGQRSGRRALLLDFSYGGAGFDSAWLVGRAYAMGLRFYPSASPLRAVVGEQRSAQVDSLAHTRSVPDEWLAMAQRCAGNPWLPLVPMLLAQVTPAYHNKAWWLHMNNSAVPLRLGDEPGWLLAAYSGGQHVNLFGEWDGEQLTPLTAWSSDGVWRNGELR